MCNIRIFFTATLVALFLSTSATVLSAADKQETAKALAPAELSIDNSRTAVADDDVDNSTDPDDE